MNYAFYLTTKFWKKHKKNLTVLIFSAVLMTSVILVFWLSEREKTNRVFDNTYSAYGYRDLTVANASDEIREEIVNGNSGVKVGSALVFGEIGDEYGIRTEGDISSMEKRLKLLPNYISSIKDEISEEQLKLKRVSDLIAAYEKIVEGNYIDNLIRAHSKSNLISIKYGLAIFSF